jgi:hypothetical protein
VEATAAKTEGKPLQQHEDEDEPHVVGFPDRAERVLDQTAAGHGTVATAGEQVPEAAAEVGAAEQRVRREGGEEDGEHRVRGGHVTGYLSTSASCGASGTGLSRASRRNT